MKAQQYIGIDIGGTKIAATSFLRGGTAVAELRCATPDTAEALLDAIVDLAVRLTGDATTLAVGIGVPGAVSPDGHVRNAVNVGIGDSGLDLGRLVSERLGVPVRVENDVKAAAVGAAALGSAVGSLVYLSIGTGMAAGVVVDGELVRGASGALGEIGHFPFDPAGPACGCGQNGCIETYASGSAIRRSWNDPRSPDAIALVQASDDGQISATHTYRRLIGGLAAAVRLIAVSQDPDLIVLGGGVTNIGERLLRDLRTELVAAGDSSAFLRSLDLPSRVTLADADAPVATYGAALVGATALTPLAAPRLAA